MHHLVLLSALTAAMGQYGVARPTCANGTCPRAQAVQVYRPAAPATYAAPAPVPVQAAAPVTYARGYQGVAAPQPASYAPTPAPVAAPAPVYYRAPAATSYRMPVSTCPNGTCNRR